MRLIAAKWVHAPTQQIISALVHETHLLVITPKAECGLPASVSATLIRQTLNSVLPPDSEDLIDTIIKFHQQTFGTRHRCLNCKEPFHGNRCPNCGSWHI